MFDIAGQTGQIGRRILSCDGVGVPPFFNNAARQRGDLIVGQHASGALRKRRHQLAGYPVRNQISQTSFSGQGDVHRIRKRDSRAVSPVFAVAGGAVLFVECREGKHFFRTHNLRSWSGPARNAAAASGGQASRRQQDCET